MNDSDDMQPDAAKFSGARSNRADGQTQPPGGTQERPPLFAHSEAPPFVVGQSGFAPPKYEGYFSVGEVLSKSFSNFFNSFLFYISLGYIAALPGIALTLYGRGAGAKIAAPIVEIFFTVIFMGAIAYGVYQNMIGEKAQLGESLARGMKQYPSLIGISLLCLVAAIPLVFSLAILGIWGALLILAVFIYALCAFSVITPACVVERLGPVASFTRSLELTRKRRGAVFGIFCVYYIALFVVSWVIEAVFPAATSPVVASSGVILNAGHNIAQTVIQPVFTAFAEVLCATLYYQLRVAREGVGVDKLANVFE